MNIIEKDFIKDLKIAVIGLGYVGMPVAVAFAKKTKVIGFDINEDKVKLYKMGYDPTKEVGDEEIKKSNVEFTSDENKLREANFYIVAVPTPINKDKTPDLRPIESASLILGKNIIKGSIIVFESTVYPGVTEEICIPILEKASGLKCGIDFKVGYSPERINPGDKKHRLENIVKVVSGCDEEALDIIAKVYELVVKVGVYKAESIKVAEAAKVIENSQRDLNIAFMNELSLIFERMQIDTKAVLKAAGTKWNFLNFSPGLVGGHCIGVDPYYLTYKAERLGYNSQVILSGRKINDSMGKHIAEILIKKLILNDINVIKSKVAILGFTFKENVPDVRNTKVIDIIDELKEYGIMPNIVDPEADYHDANSEYGIQLINIQDVKDMDAIIVAVGHESFVNLDLKSILGMYNKNNKRRKIFFDIKGVFDKNNFDESDFIYWRL